MTYAYSKPILLTLVFLGVMHLSLIFLGAMRRRLVIRSRVAEQIASERAQSTAPLRGSATGAAWLNLLQFIENRGLSLEDTNGLKLRQKLVAAGYTHPAAPRAFTLLKLTLTIGLPAVYVTSSYLLGLEHSATKLYMFGAGLALLGLFLPNVFISAKADRRQQQLTNGFPDALDLMLVCVESGLGIEAAFDRVGREMTRSHPLIADLFAATVLELRVGRAREDALRRMADRSGVEEIKSFATLLIQSSKLGSSIAQTLRVYAGEMREKRRMRAEEKAHRLPVLISLPLVGCMLPVMVGVLMLPAAIRIVRDLVPALAR